jgi:hypothetical protein
MHAKRSAATVLQRHSTSLAHSPDDIHAGAQLRVAGVLLVADNELVDGIDG